MCGDGTLPLVHISIDSRTMAGQDLFVPLIGEKVDAHRFIAQAFAAGAAAVLTSEHDQMEDEHPWIRVEDTKKALQDIGRYYRARLSLLLVGITGSVGKTTTREMIAAALSAGYRVYKTPGNHNSQVGVPITLSEITSEDEIGVLAVSYTHLHLCGVAGDFLRGVQLGIFGTIGFIVPLLIFIGTSFYMSNRGNPAAIR